MGDLVIRSYPKNSDEALSKNFWLREFHCKCRYPECRETLVDDRLVTGLQELRDLAGPLKINSAYRCKRHNKDIGGKAESYHIMGMAADVVYLMGSTVKLSNFAKRVTIFIKGGIGIYFWGCHVDTRDKPTRWYG